VLDCCAKCLHTECKVMSSLEVIPVDTAGHLLTDAALIANTSGGVLLQIVQQQVGQQQGPKVVCAQSHLQKHCPRSAGKPQTSVMGQAFSIPARKDR